MGKTPLVFGLVMLAAASTLPRAKVKSVDKAAGRLVLNVGERQKVEKGSAFIVFRGCEYVCNVIVDEVRPDECTAHIVRETVKLDPQAGDDAATAYRVDGAPGAGVPLTKPQAAPPARHAWAKVTGVDKQLGLVVINRGQRDGARKGDLVEVFRDGKRVARVVVDDVFPDLSACHYDPKATNGAVEVGDDVATSPEDKPRTGAEAMVKIVALGDSTTNCVKKAGVTEETAWRTLLAADLTKRLKRPVEVVNAGVDADIAPLALKRLERDVLDRKPDWVVIMLGTNDAGFFRPPNGVADTPRVAVEEFEKAVREIVGRIRKAGAGVALCTSLPMSGHYGLRNLPAYKQNGLNYLVKQYAEVTRRLAKELGLPVAEVHEAFEKHPQRDALIPDGIHPNAAGQRLIADTLLPILVRALTE